MRWIEAVISTESGSIDALCARLEEFDLGGVSIEDDNYLKDVVEENHRFWEYVDEARVSRGAGTSRVRFYLEDNEAGQAKLQAIKAALQTEITVGYLEDEDWANSWKSCYEPLPVGERLLIVPEWMEAEAEGRIALRLDPGIAFGTGSHPTTRMLLEALESVKTEGERALDLGCGSGILSIAALLLGCAGAVGCDIDPKSPEASLANAALNGVGAETFRVYAGDVLSDEGLRRRLGTGYGIVMANIVAEVIVPLTRFVRRFMAENAVFLCSGIIDGRVPEVEAALRREDFEIVRRYREEEWNAFVCR